MDIGRLLDGQCLDRVFDAAPLRTSFAMTSTWALAQPLFSFTAARGWDHVPS